MSNVSHMQQFIHAIDLRNWHACHNLSLNGCLHTPNALALVDPGIGEQHQLIDNISIEELAQGFHPSTVVAPRAIGEVIRAGILRNSMQIANGFNEVEIISEETKRNALDCSDVELSFESARRKIAPTAPSRLSCLYLAERTEAGEQMLGEMLGASIFILHVELLMTLRIQKVDSAWFDDFFVSRNPENAIKYWQGQEMHQGGRWEYLFDGTVKVEDTMQIEYIRKHGARL